MARETGPGDDHRFNHSRRNGEPARFHYNREERLAGRPDAPSRGGFLFRNRSLAIVLIDLLVVFVVFVLLRLFLFSGGQQVTAGPFGLSLEAFSFEDETYITLSVEALEDVGPREGADSLIEVEFPDGTRVTDVVPVERGVIVEVRHVMPGLASEEVAVTVFVDGETVQISKSVGQ